MRVRRADVAPAPLLARAAPITASRCELPGGVERADRGARREESGGAGGTREGDGDGSGD